MMTRRQAGIVLGATLTSFAAETDTQDGVRCYRVPNGGIQPQMAIDDRGILYLVYSQRHGRFPQQNAIARANHQVAAYSLQRHGLAGQPAEAQGVESRGLQDWTKF
jgi:hypothetical protein